jgi:hypothetical protein
MREVFVGLVVLAMAIAATASAQDGAASGKGYGFNFAESTCPSAVCATAENLRDAKAIDAILYGNYSREDRLARLKPYAEPMQSLDDVKRQVALDACVTSGPGVMDCGVVGSGLSLVFDPDKKLRLIRRRTRVIDGATQPEQSITDRGFEWHGYRRWYEN